MIEGMVAGVTNIYGTDLNPLAQLISKVRTTPLSDNQIVLIKDIFINSLKQEFKKHMSNVESFENFIINERKLDITEKKGWGYNTLEIINDFKKSYNNNFNFPNFTNIGFWFQPKAVYELQIIKNTINKLKDKDIKDFF